MTISDTGHIIGVDGGGSTCRVAIADAGGTRIGGASGPSSNPATSMKDAVACLLNTLDAARLDAGLTKAQIGDAAAYLGLAGAINSEISGAVGMAMPMRRIVVADDRASNLVGALARQDGYIAALGTGSFIGCRKGAAHTFVGGWGLWLGDQASGAWMGRALLSRVLEWRDGLHPGSALLEETYAAFDHNPSGIVMFATEAKPKAFGELAPSVLRAAADGDGAGKVIVSACADYVARALDALGYRHGDALCLTGGVGAPMAAHLDPQYTANLIEPRGTALDGALQLAARLGESATA